MKSWEFNIAMGNNEYLAYKAISVRQPWAAAIASGEKIYEYRDWAPPLLYGPIVICSTAKPSDDLYEDEYEDTVNKEVNGCTMCLVYVDKCEEGETGLGQETPRWPNGYRYRWTLSNPKPLHHVPVKGALGMFQVPFNIVVLNEMETCND